jgi:hypothetical protein
MNERTVRLELEQRRLALVADAVELGPQRPRPLPPGERVVLEEVVLGQPPVELLVGDEPVVDPVDLAGPAFPRRGGHRERDLRDAPQQLLNERPLAGTRGAGDHQNRRLLTC